MRSQVQPRLGPRSKMVCDGDGAPIGLLVDAVRDVLPERRRARDGRLVDLLVLPDLVRAAVAREGPQLLALRRALAVRRPLLHVVLDEGVARPAVDGDEDRAGAAGGAAREGDVPGVGVLGWDVGRMKHEIRGRRDG